MLYPVNIKIEEKRKRKILKENLENLKNKIAEKIEYLIFDRTNLGKKILVKLHI